MFSKTISLSILYVLAYIAVLPCAYSHNLRGYDMNIRNVTKHEYENSLPSLYNSTNDFVADDLKIQNIEMHRRMGTEPWYSLWDNWYKNGYYWVRVYINPSFSSTHRSLIIKSLRSIQFRAKVMKFKILTNKPNKPFINIIDGNGCWSYYGRNYDAHTGQDLSLSSNGCMTSRTIQHEVMHALGVAHHHNRPDRDQYISVQLQNVKSNYKSEFEIWNTIDSLGIKYDLNSIMHYSEYTFSVNPYSRSYPTIVPRNNKKIGSLNDASWNDIVLLRLMYQCKTSTGTRTLSQFNAAPCTHSCTCWKNRPGCKGKNSLCKGNMKCHKNVCKDPNDI